MDKNTADKKIKLFEYNSKIESNKNKIIKSLKLHKNDVFNNKTIDLLLIKILEGLFNQLPEEFEDYNVLSSILFEALKNWNVIKTYSINNNFYYTFGYSLDYKLLILSNAYNELFFSHSTASYIHGLSESFDDIYMSKLIQNKTNELADLNQNNINKAFGKKMRSIKKPLELKNENNDEYNNLFLLSQYCDKNKFRREDLGIISKKVKGKFILVSSMERLLIDIVVRPGYAESLESIIKIYSNAKPNINTKKLYQILKNLNYVYPYHQPIGFLLESTGYNNSDLETFKKIPMKFNFYIDYDLNKNDLNFSNTWKLYYPKI